MLVKGTPGSRQRRQENSAAYIVISHSSNHFTHMLAIILLSLNRYERLKYGRPTVTWKFSGPNYTICYVPLNC